MAKSIQRRVRGLFSEIERAVEGKPRWQTKPATIATIILLCFIAVAQLLRLIFHVKVIANGVAIPLWGSAIACIVAALLAVMLWRESRR
jgi:hypothetical protein